MHEVSIKVIIVVKIIALSLSNPAAASGQTSLDTMEENGLIYFHRAKEALQNEEYDQALKFYQRGLPSLAKQDQNSKYCEALIELSVLHYWKNELDQAIEYCVLAKDIMKQSKEKESELYGSCLLNLGAFYYEKRNISKALECEKEAINILEIYSPESERVANLLNNMAFTQDIIGEYSEAISNMSRSLEYRLKTFGPVHERAALSFYTLGILHKGIKEYKKAKGYFLDNYHILTKLKRVDQNLEDSEFIQAFQNLAECHLALNDQDSSNFYLRKAFLLQKEDDSFRKYLTFELQTQLLLNQKNIDEAKYNANKAIKAAHTAFINFNKHPNLARQYTHLGEVFQENNELDSAVYYLHKALIFLAHNFEEESFESNPDPGNVFLEYFSIRSLKGKAKALYLHYLQSQDVRDLKASLATYEMTHEFIGRLKQDFSTMGSKQQLAGDVLEVYEGAIETALALHEATGDQTYLEKAFFFAEANKAIILLESMNERMAQSASGIPDSLLEKEKQYRVDIAYYERSVNEEHNKKTEPDADKIKKWEDQLYTLRREYQQLIDQFEVQYPKYFKLKYDTQLAGLAAVRKNLLNRKAAFLEYFVGLEKVFLFQITKKDFQVFSFEKSEHFQEDMQELLQLARKKQVIASEASRLQELMYQVYQDYVAKGVETLPKNIDRLLIVPDDVLNLVPFEILSAEEEGTQYLIQDYNIGYAYSATLFQKGQTKKQQQAEHLYLGFAPSFSTQIAENRDCSGEVLANLTHSANEIISVQELLGGEVMLGKQAKSDFFLDQAGHYKIIHLATHACMDEENPMQSKVFFADQPIINQELFNLNLSADMAVLSACNTGSGQLVKGDGVMSLSKGFIHAGCPSALVSLWSVDDYSTSEIMINFYKYLKKGQSKDKAIRNAKLEYLASADKVKRHPFYWAAFIHMGDPVALDFGGQNRKWIWMTVIGVIGLLLLGQRFRKQQDIAA